MKEKIKAYAKEMKIEYVGIVTAKPMEALKEMLSNKREEYGITPFEEKDIEKRTNPLKTMPEAKSIIVCLFPYANGGGGAKNVSKYARIPDYHKVVMGYLNRLCDYIQGEVPSCKLLPYTDNGPLVDKFLAYQAGLGFFGKNTLLINETYGSFCFIGYIITDLRMKADVPQEQECGACDICIRSCPGKALDGSGGIFAQNCVSYITQSQTITDEQRRILESQGYIYGCDVCQDVCPFNRNIPVTPIPEFAVPTLKFPEKETLKMMSNREFKREYGMYPFSWCKKDTILKNFGK